MDAQFHPAQAALARGDVADLVGLLAANPELARARSQQSHPTLLQCLVLTMPPADALEELIAILADHGAELTDPLIAAAGIDNVRAITKLLDLGANIEGNGLWSPLEEALYWGHDAAVRLVLERGTVPRNLRCYAALGDREGIARCFGPSGELTVDAGEVAWPFFRVPMPETVRRDRAQILGNAFVFAASWGQIASVADLLARGAQVNLIPAGFDYAGTALHYAALRGRRELVDHLLAVGADPTVRDTKIGKLPEDWAAHGGHAELAEHLRLVRERAGESTPTDTRAN
jgi:ankyrin repeat protein